MKFAQPTNLDAALRLLKSGNWSIVSGGTDFYPTLGDRPLQNNTLDISRLHDLKSIRSDQEYWQIGSLVTWSDVIHANLPPAFDALKMAAREVGSIHIQNRATLAGNLCNASPAADGVPPLLCLDAKVELRSNAGVRVLPLQEFITGNRSIERRCDEIMSSILIPKYSALGKSSFTKLGARRYLVISIAMVAANISWNETGLITKAAVAVGACSEVACRLYELENSLLGMKTSEIQRIQVTDSMLSRLSPIDDVRATGSYRKTATGQLILRTLAGALSS